MKQFKKITSLVLAVCLIAAFEAPLMVSAEEYPVSKTELVNVAENKPITASDIHAVPEIPITHLVDGERGTWMQSECGPDRAASEVLTVDLLRRCKIELVELYDRYDLDYPSGRQYIEIVGANKADLSDGVVLGSLGAQDDTLFPHGGKLSFELDGKKAYRYVALKRTGGGDYMYGEFRVWAKQTVTDIARGITNDSVISDALNDSNHWIYDFGTPENMFDGSSSGDWIEDGNAYRYMRIDLGREYNIGMIEMTGRDYSGSGSIDNEWARKYINLYVTNNDSTDNTIYDPYSKPDDNELAELGFKRIVKLGPAAVIDCENPFPAYFVPSGSEETYGNAGSFQATVDDTMSARYLVYKTTLEVGTGLSSLRAYVVHPEVLGGEFATDTITVNFTDEMDTSTFNEDNIKVYVDDVKKTPVIYYDDDYTLKLQLDKAYFDATIKVVLSNDILNQKNVGLLNPETVTLLAPPAIEIKDFAFTADALAEGAAIDALAGTPEAGVRATLKNHMPEGSEKAVMFIMAFDENNTLIGIDEYSNTIDAGNEVPFICGLDFNGETPARLTAFIWRDYGLMKPWMASKTIKQAPPEPPAEAE